MAAALMPIFIASSVISTAAGVMGSIQQANATAQAADYNAQVAENNAKIAAQEKAMQQAQYEREQSIIADQTAREAELVRVKNLRFQASQRAAITGSGGALSGSGLDVINDAAVQNEIDVKNLEYSGLLRSWEKQYQSRVSAFNSDVSIANYQAQAGLARMESSSARSSVGMSVLGGVASGAANFASGAQYFRGWGMPKNSVTRR